MPPNINIISPSTFTTVPWKNGLGETIEMAINSGGTLNKFDWRLSMASVIEDGQFSNFEGYTRNLILIEGNGINLQHNDSKIDKLANLLDIATFDGGNKTIGNLHAGEITDFNVITRTECVKTQVIAEKKLIDYALEKSDICFAFSLYRDANLTLNHSNDVISLPPQHLLKLENNTDNFASISGTHLIIVYLT